MPGVTFGWPAVLLQLHKRMRKFGYLFQRACYRRHAAAAAFQDNRMVRENLLVSGHKCTNEKITMVALPCGNEFMVTTGVAGAGAAVR